MTARAMRRIVQRDFHIVIGGPVGAKKIVASFARGEVLCVQRTGAKGEYPKRYRIIGGTYDGRIFSRGVFAQFLRGFEPRRRKEKKPGSH